MNSFILNQIGTVVSSGNKNYCNLEIFFCIALKVGAYFNANCIVGKEKALG